MQRQQNFLTDWIWDVKGREGSEWFFYLRNRKNRDIITWDEEGLRWCEFGEKEWSAIQWGAYSVWNVCLMSKWICLINSWTCDLHFTGQVQVRGVNVKSSVIGDTLSHETQWDHYGNEHSLEREKERSPDWLGGCSKVRGLGRWKEARKGECGGEATVSIFQPGKPYTCVCSSPICTSPSWNIYMENDSMMVRCLPPLITSNYFTLYIILPLKVMWRVEWWPYREQAIFPFPLPLLHNV